MTSRSIFWSGSQLRAPFDIGSFESDVLVADSHLMRLILGLPDTVGAAAGYNTSLVSGFGPPGGTGAPGTHPYYVGNVISWVDGYAIWRAPLDDVSVGNFAASTTPVYHVWHSTTGTMTLTPPSLTSGQGVYVLIYSIPGQVSKVRTSDPNGGVLPFYNSANPTVPLNGQGNTGQVLPTERSYSFNVASVNGTAATIGSEAYPTIPAGAIPLLLVHYSYGGSGPDNCFQDPRAYWLAGLLSQHHTGVAGQAPKIQLTGAAEVQGVLPGANLAPGAAALNVGPLSGMVNGTLPLVYINRLPQPYLLSGAVGQTITYLVPAGVYRAYIFLQAAGASGSPPGSLTALSPGGGGGGAGMTLELWAYVHPGDGITAILGSPGIGVATAATAGNDAGLSSLSINGQAFTISGGLGAGASPVALGGPGGSGSGGLGGNNYTLPATYTPNAAGDNLLNWIVSFGGSGADGGADGYSGGQGGASFRGGGSRGFVGAASRGGYSLSYGAGSGGGYGTGASSTLTGGPYLLIIEPII